MKAHTRKYQNLNNAIYKIGNELDGNWSKGYFSEPTQARKEYLNAKLKEYEKKQEELRKTISQEDFESDLSDNMCCTWEDFNNN